jgi:pilus assembly protein Flp/PilA
MQETVIRLLRDQEGATAIEYGLLVAVIAVVIAGVAIIVGENLSSLFSDVAGCIADPSITNCI